MDINTILSQNSFSVVCNPPVSSGSGLWIKVPYDRKDTNDPSRYKWLCNLFPRKPIWFKEYKAWIVPKCHLQFITKKLLDRFGCVILVQLHKEKEICAPACWNATGLECHCSCLGVNHGTGQLGGRWYILGDAYAVQWNNTMVSCQFLIKDQMK